MATCNPGKQDFFDTMIPLVRPMATRLTVDEDFLLAIVAFEDSWGQDAHNKKLHNIFGLTKAGGNNLAFSSYQACVDYWERNYGAKVKGIQDLEKFIAAMKEIGYNSVNPSYYSTFRDVYRSVRAYKSACKVK